LEDLVGTIGADPFDLQMPPVDLQMPSTGQMS
jgi:hypothetical protein